MISHKHKFIFIHIPKTGGTSIESIFKPSAVDKDVRLKHNPISTKIFQKPKFNDYFKFTIVRNPWDLVCSLYNYMWKSDYSWPMSWRKKKKVNAPYHLKLTLSEWVKDPSFKHTSPRSLSIFSKPGRFAEKNQIDWLTNKKGKMIMDYVGRFENLQSDFNVICKKIGIPSTKLSHTNKSNSKSYHKFYDDEAIDIVRRHYARDIEYFGYEFGYEK
jgi:hypothetical protein